MLLKLNTRVFLVGKYIWRPINLLYVRVQTFILKVQFIRKFIYYKWHFFLKYLISMCNLIIYFYLLHIPFYKLCYNTYCHLFPNIDSSWVLILIRKALFDFTMKWEWPTFNKKFQILPIFLIVNSWIMCRLIIYVLRKAV